MDHPPIYGVLTLLFLVGLLTFTPPALSQETTPPINSNSILVALLDSHYTELSELIEKALLLQTLERAVSELNVTILAPRNDALQRRLDPEFRRFLLEPRNLKSLQDLVLFHVLPARIEAGKWPAGRPKWHGTLLSEKYEKIQLHVDGDGARTVDVGTKVTRPDDVVRPDGVIHGIDKLLVPKSVQQAFNQRRSLRDITAVLPEGAPEVDPRTHRLKKPGQPVPVGSPPILPIYEAMSPGPSLAPAPAPGPGGPHHHFDGHKQIKDFIQTLLHYGGYNEMADILVNLTSLASEMGRLVSEGYVLTVLAPNDEAMAKLSADQLSEAGAPEQIMYYHLIPEYQTEESMYNAVRRFGKVRYDTLRLPHRVVAEEADGSVRFGQGDGSAYLFDPDIYTDGRISVQGIDGVLFPAEESGGGRRSNKVVAKVAEEPRRGKLMEKACRILGFMGQDSHFSGCH